MYKVLVWNDEMTAGTVTIEKSDIKTSLSSNNTYLEHFLDCLTINGNSGKKKFKVDVQRFREKI